jgi:hypothetical protein
MDPAVGALLAGAFALLFASAALHKLVDPARFGAAFRAYELVPASLAWVAALLPVLELAVAVALLPETSRSGAAAAGAVLLLLYAAAMAVNLARGRRDLDCGCGGPSTRRLVGPWMVGRNLLLATVLGALLLPSAPRALGAVDALTIGAGTAVAALLYMTLDVLLARVAPQVARLAKGGRA